jgi:hypothetical protein
MSENDILADLLKHEPEARTPAAERFTAELPAVSG